MHEDLTARSCTPCQGGIPPLERVAAQAFLERMPGWNLLDDATRIEKRFTFANFREAMDFVTRVGQLSENEGHHPDIAFGWGWATVSWQTKKIRGLHENDFIMAAKTERLLL
jgi:4a-hydroxytetrahydrobiopterin dehydratase